MGKGIRRDVLTPYVWCFFLAFAVPLEYISAMLVVLVYDDRFLLPEVVDGRHLLVLPRLLLLTGLFT
mgnify:CR=1 FL=1